MGPEETLQVKTLLLVPLLVPLLVLLLVPLLGLLLVLLPVLLLVLLVLTPLLQIRVLAHAEAWVLLDALLEGRTGAASQEEERRQAASLYGALCASLLRSRPSEFMFRAVAVNLERSLRQHAGLEVRSFLPALLGLLGASGYNSADFELLMAVAEHPQSSVEEGPALHLASFLQAVCVGDALHGRLAAAVYLALLDRWHAKPSIVSKLMDFAEAELDDLVATTDRSAAGQVGQAEGVAERQALLLELLAKVLALERESLLVPLAEIIGNAQKKAEDAVVERILTPRSTAAATEHAGGTGALVSKGLQELHRAADAAAKPAQYKAMQEKMAAEQKRVLEARRLQAAQRSAEADIMDQWRTEHTPEASHRRVQRLYADVDAVDGDDDDERTVSKHLFQKTDEWIGSAVGDTPPQWAPEPGGATGGKAGGGVRFGAEPAQEQRASDGGGGGGGGGESETFETPRRHVRWERGATLPSIGAGLDADADAALPSPSPRYAGGKANAGFTPRPQLGRSFSDEEDEDEELQSELQRTRAELESALESALQLELEIESPNGASPTKKKGSLSLLRNSKRDEQKHQRRMSMSATGNSGELTRPRAGYGENAHKHNGDAWLDMLRRRLRAVSVGGRGGEDWAQLFGQYDRDRSKGLEEKEFMLCLRRSCGLHADGRGKVSDKELRKVFRSVDSDGNGSISADEFEEWLGAGMSSEQVVLSHEAPQRRLNVAQEHLSEHKVDKKNLSPQHRLLIKSQLKANATRVGGGHNDIATTFQRRDKDRSGQLDCAEFIDAVRMTGHVPSNPRDPDFVSDAELMQVFHEADVDNDGEISIEEFQLWLSVNPSALPDLEEMSHSERQQRRRELHASGHSHDHGHDHVSVTAGKPTPPRGRGSYPVGSGRSAAQSRSLPTKPSPNASRRRKITGTQQIKIKGAPEQQYSNRGEVLAICDQLIEELLVDVVSGMGGRRLAAAARQEYADEDDYEGRNVSPLKKGKEKSRKSTTNSIYDMAQLDSPRDAQRKYDAQNSFKGDGGALKRCAPDAKLAQFRAHKEKEARELEAEIAIISRVMGLSRDDAKARVTRHQHELRMAALAEKKAAEHKQKHAKKDAAPDLTLMSAEERAGYAAELQMRADMQEAEQKRRLKKAIAAQRILRPPKQHAAVSDPTLKKRIALRNVKSKLRAKAATASGGVDLEQSFKLRDRDGSGALDREEFCAAIHATMSMGRRMSTLKLEGHISDAELNAVFRHVDADGSGEVTVDEYVAWMNEPDEPLESKSPPKPKRNQRVIGAAQKKKKQAAADRPKPRESSPSKSASASSPVKSIAEGDEGEGAAPDSESKPEVEPAEEEEEERQVRGQLDGAIDDHADDDRIDQQATSQDSPPRKQGPRLSREQKRLAALTPEQAQAERAAKVVAEAQRAAAAAVAQERAEYAAQAVREMDAANARKIAELAVLKRLKRQEKEAAQAQERRAQAQAAKAKAEARRAAKLQENIERANQLGAEEKEQDAARAAATRLAEEERVARGKEEAAQRAQLGAAKAAMQEAQAAMAAAQAAQAAQQGPEPEPEAAAKPEPEPEPERQPEDLEIDEPDQQAAAPEAGAPAAAAETGA